MLYLMDMESDQKQMLKVDINKHKQVTSMEHAKQTWFRDSLDVSAYAL